MPMSDANRVALRSFLTTRRGGRVLQDDIQVALLTYFVAKTHPVARRMLHVTTRENPPLLDRRSTCGIRGPLQQAARVQCMLRCMHEMRVHTCRSGTLYFGVRCVRARVVRAYGSARARCPPTALRPLGDEPLSRDCIGCVEAVVRSCV